MNVQAAFSIATPGVNVESTLADAQRRVRSTVSAEADKICVSCLHRGSHRTRFEKSRQVKWGVDPDWKRATISIDLFDKSHNQPQYTRRLCARGETGSDG